MTKSEYIDALSRRLGPPVARIEGILERLHAAGMIRPIKGSRRFPPDIDEHDAVALLLAVLADRGLDAAADNAWSLASMQSEAGSFSDFVGELLFGPPIHVRHLIVGPSGASTMVDGCHVVFGDEGSGASRFYQGAAIMGLAAELKGMSESDADAAAAIIGIMK